MDLIFSVGKVILFVPLWALIQSPFLRWSAKLAKVSTVSYTSAFILGLITGAAALIVGLLGYPVFALIDASLYDIVALLIACVTTTLLYSYFLRSEQGKSVGVWAGAKVFILQTVLFIVLLFALSYLAVLIIDAFT